MVKSDYYYYNSGFRDGYLEGAIARNKELQELREYKSKVEKFISKNRILVINIPMQKILDMLEKELNYEDIKKVE